MAVYDGVPGIGVTPLYNGLPVGPTNPLPIVVLPAGFAFASVVAGGLAAGDNLLVAATAGKKIRVYSFSIDTATDVLDAFFKSSTGPGTQVSVKRTNITTWREQSPLGLFETAAGAALYLNASVAAAGATLNLAYSLAD